MKQSLRSRLLLYLDFSDKSEGGNDILFNMYKMGLWETYFFYYPPAYTMTKKAISHPNTVDPDPISCWGRYFGKNVY